MRQASDAARIAYSHYTTLEYESGVNPQLATVTQLAKAYGMLTSELVALAEVEPEEDEVSKKTRQKYPSKETGKRYYWE